MSVDKKKEFIELIFDGLWAIEYERSQRMLDDSPENVCVCDFIEKKKEELLKEVGE